MQRLPRVNETRRQACGHPLVLGGGCQNHDATDDVIEI